MAISRRQLLATAAYCAAGTVAARARMISGALPWNPDAGTPPHPVRPGPWQFFTSDEARAIEALADRIIPADAETPGGKDAGLAVYLDRQLAGPYGRGEGLYIRPPFVKGTQQQGHQSAGGFAKTYRDGLAALDKATKANYAGRSFAELPDDNKDHVLQGLEKGDFKLEGADGKEFFEQLIK